MTSKNLNPDNLPTVSFIKHMFDDSRMMASSGIGPEEQWRIEATLVRIVGEEPYVRCIISLFGRVVADVGVYDSGCDENFSLWDEAQAVSAAILWSAIRGYRLNKSST